MALSERGRFSKDFPNFFFEWATPVMTDGYDKETNPKVRLYYNNFILI